MIGYCTVCRVHYDTLEAYVWHTEHCAGPVICRRHQASKCACPPYQPRPSGTASTTSTTKEPAA